MGTLRPQSIKSSPHPTVASAVHLLQVIYVRDPPINSSHIVHNLYTPQTRPDQQNLNNKNQQNHNHKPNQARKNKNLKN
jgi:hypothetical protein